MDVCVRMWLFTQGPLENAARVSEACRPTDEVKGFRVPHNSPLSIVRRENGHFGTTQRSLWFKVKGCKHQPLGVIRYQNEHTEAWYKAF